MDYKDKESQNKSINSEKNIICDDQLDQLTKDQDWKQNYWDLE